MARVSTALRKRKTAIKLDNASLVLGCYSEITALSRAMLAPASDRRMNCLVDALHEAAIRLAASPSVDCIDIEAKIAILCGRLREHLHPEHRGELVNYLLAESLRDDLRLLCRDGRT